ncbi:MAG TPA: hypothetical protein VFX43_21755 [Chitinophagaceae bacterium]|nr:hypothetical protein [Chitinophagaceae bacterium]
MIGRFLKIRILQVGRELSSLGWWRTVVLLAVLAVGGIAIYRQTGLYPNCLYVTAVAALVVLGIHLYRKDKEFILLTGTDPMKIYVAEYAFFSVPVFILMLFTEHWYCAILLLAVYFLLSLIRYTPGKKTRTGYAPAIIPRDNFEWMAGIRGNLPVILVLYVAALGLLIYPYASIFVLWLLLGLIASFYQWCEPSDILQLAELPPKGFIRRKLKSHLKGYLFFSAPILIGYVIFQPATAWVALVIYAISFINLAFFILSKYAVYQPCHSSPAGNVLTSVIHFCMFVPFLLPLPLLMCLRAYKKSQHQLKEYLDAYR